MHSIPVLGGWRQEDQEFVVSLVCMRYCLKRKKNTRKRNKRRKEESERQRERWQKKPAL